MVNFPEKDKDKDLRARPFLQPTLPSTSSIQHAMMSTPNLSMQQRQRQMPIQQQHLQPPFDLSTNVPLKSTRSTHSRSVKLKNKNLLQDKDHRCQSWHDYPKEKRTLRKNNLGAPDVFPQEPQQEEDSMSHEKIKKGFIPQVLPCETESAIPRFLNDTSKTADDLLIKVANYIQQILPAKNEMAVPNLDKKRLNDIKFIPLIKENDKVPIHKVMQWFKDLCRGKAYHLLVKRVPMTEKLELVFDMCFDNKIPVPNVLWYIFTLHVARSAMLKNNKKAIELPDYTAFFGKIIKDTLEKVDEDVSTARQKWKYVTLLVKNCISCGMVDRQEFLYELCEQLMELHQKPMEKMLTFRLLLTYASLFTKEIVSNAVIARKYLYLAGIRLRAYVDEYEKKKRVKISPYKILTDLIECVHHRPIILTCIGLATAIIIDCPVAAIWTPLEETNFVPFLVGTPLEVFPIDPMHFSILVKHSTEYAQNLRVILAKRLGEIRERSYNVDQRWALNGKNSTGFQTVMKVCIDVVSYLDTADLYNPAAFLPLYAKVYGLVKDLDTFEDETVIRTKAMFHWAITSEREGSHRAFLVTKLVKKHIEHFQSKLLDGKTIAVVMVDFLNKEGPQPDKKNFQIEFANLMLLLFEMQREKVLLHDEYVNLLVRYCVVDTKDPIITRLKRISVEREAEIARNNVPSRIDDPPDSEPIIMSFIPTPAELRQQKGEKHEPLQYCVLKDDIDTKRPYMDASLDVTLHERILIHLPIQQNDSMRGMINQRLMLLHGITNEREIATHEARKFAECVIKAWNKNAVQYYNSSKLLRRRSNLGDLNKALQDFKEFTYYDQLMIAGLCSDHYKKGITEFPKTSNMQPNMECLDMLLAMFEQAQAVGEAIAYVYQILPIIFNCVKNLDDFRTDGIPGFFSAQQAFVIVGFLADHYKYFLLSEDAVSTINGLYRLVEREVMLKGYPISCWARTVAVFLMHARYDLRAHDKDSSFAFTMKDCKELMPEPSTGDMDFRDVRYNKVLLEELLNQPKRCISYHDFKIRLPSLEDKSSRYSFVINAFRTMKQFKNDSERISELANICGHVSAQKDLTTEWLAVIEMLCSPSTSKKTQLPGFNQLDPVDDYNTHFFYATFITMLTSRYCFSSHELFVRLNNSAIVPFVKQSKVMLSSQENKARLLLTLQIVSNIVTASDEPFQLSKDFFYPDKDRTYILERSSELKCLSILHIRELDAIILSVLTNLFFIADALKKEDSLKEIYNFLFNALLTMSDQEWVIERMFQICHNDREIDEFNTGFFSTDALGQYLLRISMRRKCERDIKIDLVNSKGSKKALIDKLFSVLTIWNIRATYCDLRVMIKDTTPGKGTKYQQQNTIVADALMKEISRSCRDFFFSAEKLNEIKAPQVSMFEFADLNAYWLISELLDIVQPENVTKTIKTLFLDEMLNLITIAQPGMDEEEKTKRMKQSAKLLGEQPFINMILTCQNNEDKGREPMIKAMFGFCQEIMKKYEARPELAVGRQFELERESMLLRLSLIGGMIDFNQTSPNDIMTYAVALSSLLLNDAIMKDRDGVYYYHVYDMLTMCVYSFLSGPGAIPCNEKNETPPKRRYNDYYNFFDKFKKDLGKRQIPLKHYAIQQLLPIKENYGELQNFNDTFSLVSPPKTALTRIHPMSAGYTRNAKNVRLDKFAEPIQKRFLRMIYHSHQNDFVVPGTPGKPLTKQQLESFVVGPPEYVSAPKVAQPTGPPTQPHYAPPPQHLQNQNRGDMRPNFPMHGQAQQQFYPGQQGQQQLQPPMQRPQLQQQHPMYQGRPPVPGQHHPISAGNFPGGPVPSTSGTMMPPNFPSSSQSNLPPIPGPGPVQMQSSMPPNQQQQQPQNFGNMQMYQQHQQQRGLGPGPGPGFAPLNQRMPHPEQMVRPQLPPQPRPAQIKKRPSATALAPTPQTPNKRMRKAAEVPPQQPPQIPGNAPPTLPPPGYYQQQQQPQQQHWNQQQNFNVLRQPQPTQQQPQRFSDPGLLPNQQMMQQQRTEETKEILKAKLQKKKDDQAINRMAPLPPQQQQQQQQHTARQQPQQMGHVPPPQHMMQMNQMPGGGQRMPPMGMGPQPGQGPGHGQMPPQMGHNQYPPGHPMYQMQLGNQPQQQQRAPPHNFNPQMR